MNNILRRLSLLRSVDHSRMMSSTAAVAVRSTKSPWVYVSMRPFDFYINFYCIAKKEVYSFFCNEYWAPHPYRRARPWEIMLRLLDPDIVGSSHGWLVWYDPKHRRPFLLDPTADRRMDLPSLPTDITDDVGRFVLEEKSRLAFITCGGKIAFCSPCSSNHWTLFNEKEKEKEKERIFDDLLYSSRHDRLFCLVGEENTKSKSKLECWKVDPSPPIVVELEWTMEVMVEVEAEADEKKKKLKYIVCDEDTGELYVVVRHVEVNMKSNLTWHEFANKFSSYTTLDINVYRIDWERREVMLMEDSLNGLSIFVGKNQSFAMVASEVPGLNPDSVYFSSDHRLTPPQQVIHDKWDDHKDVTGSGVFDYLKRTVSPLFNSNLIMLQSDPIWFTPRQRKLVYVYPTAVQIKC